MTPQERQLRILEFIERYQRDRRDAPTIREVVMGSGVSSYQDITGDIESLLQRRMVAWVADSLIGVRPPAQSWITLSFSGRWRMRRLGPWYSAMVVSWPVDFLPS